MKIQGIENLAEIPITNCRILIWNFTNLPGIERFTKIGLCRARWFPAIFVTTAKLFSYSVGLKLFIILMSHKNCLYNTILWHLFVIVNLTVFTIFRVKTAAFGSIPVKPSGSADNTTVYRLDVTTVQSVNFYLLNPVALQSHFDRRRWLHHNISVIAEIEKIIVTVSYL